MPSTRQLVTILAFAAITCLPSLGNDVGQGADPSLHNDQERSARALEEQLNQLKIESRFHRANYHLGGCVLEVKSVSTEPCQDPREERSTTDVIDFAEMRPDVEIKNVPNRPGQDSIYFYINEELEKHTFPSFGVPNDDSVEQFLEDNEVSSRRITRTCGEVEFRAPMSISAAPIRTGNHAELESSIESYMKAYCSSE